MLRNPGRSLDEAKILMRPSRNELRFDPITDAQLLSVSRRGANNPHSQARTQPANSTRRAIRLAPSRFLCPPSLCWTLHICLPTGTSRDISSWAVSEAAAIAILYQYGEDDLAIKYACVARARGRAIRSAAIAVTLTQHIYRCCYHASAAAIQADTQGTCARSNCDSKNTTRCGKIIP